MGEIPPKLASLSTSLDNDRVDSTESGDNPWRQAAVLVLLFPTNDGICFFLTSRPTTLRHHAGQISLPGGGREPTDVSLWQTALRETAEELGIATQTILQLGKLPNVLVQASGNTIAPFVGWSAEVPSVNPDPAEVSAVRAVTLDSVLDTRNVREDQWHLRGANWRVTMFDFDGWQVWGATARVLAELRAHLQPDLRAAYPAPGSVLPL